MSREKSLYVITTSLLFTHSNILGPICVLQALKFAMTEWDVSQMIYHGLELQRDQFIDYPGAQKR